MNYGGTLFSACQTIFDGHSFRLCQCNVIHYFLQGNLKKNKQKEKREKNSEPFPFPDVPSLKKIKRREPTFELNSDSLKCDPCSNKQSNSTNYKKAHMCVRAPVGVRAQVCVNTIHAMIV